MEFSTKKRWYEISDSVHTLLQLRRKEDMCLSPTTPDIQQKIIQALDKARYLLQDEQLRIAKENSHVK